MKNKKIILPIGEYDLEIFQEVVDGFSTHINWTFETECGEPIDIRFTQDNEED